MRQVGGEMMNEECGRRNQEGGRREEGRKERNAECTMRKKE